MFLDNILIQSLNPLRLSLLRNLGLAFVNFRDLEFWFFMRYRVTII